MSVWFFSIGKVVLDTDPNPTPNNKRCNIQQCPSSAAPCTINNGVKHITNVQMLGNALNNEKLAKLQITSLDCLEVNDESLKWTSLGLPVYLRKISPMLPVNVNMKILEVLLPVIIKRCDYIQLHMFIKSSPGEQGSY